ncbi:MAG: DNA-deoxyinosine glycosylase, partial [Anaerostipes faecalis]|nr:DNA-deoxyinosine glycosylase [Anaerostipes faecalis]
MEYVVHQIHPVFNSQSEILILGSFPSVKSREACFFYHHPQNRFWKVLSAVFQDSVPETIEEKKIFLLKHHI